MSAPLGRVRREDLEPVYAEAAAFRSTQTAAAVEVPPAANGDGGRTELALCTLWSPADQPGPAEVRSGLAVAPHVYLSTGCLHGNHAYCAARAGRVGGKRPAECKFCGAACVCPCHQTTAAAIPAVEPTAVSEPRAIRLGPAVGLRERLIDAGLPCEKFVAEDGYASVAVRSNGEAADAALRVFAEWLREDTTPRWYADREIGPVPTVSLDDLEIANWHEDWTGERDAAVVFMRQLADHIDPTVERPADAPVVPAPPPGAGRATPPDRDDSTGGVAP